MVNLIHRSIRVNGGFGVSKVLTSTQDKEHGKDPKKSKMWNCKHRWRKMIRNCKNNSPSNWALVNELLPIGCERWERFRIPVYGYHMSWTTGKWKNAKTLLTFCSFSKKSLHRIVTGDKKWIYFENPKRKKLWADPGAPSISTTRSNRFGGKTMLCVWWD